MGRKLPPIRKLGIKRLFIVIMLFGFRRLGGLLMGMFGLLVVCLVGFLISFPLTSAFKTSSFEPLPPSSLLPISIAIGDCMTKKLKLTRTIYRTAGMDGALDLIKFIWGEKAANDSTTGMEYDRHYNASWDPFAEYWGVS